MANATQPEFNHNPKILKVYLYYRLGLAVVLFLMFVSEISPSSLGSSSPSLFMWTAVVYTLLCIASLYFFPPQELTHSFHRITVLLVIDILANIILIHASGGIASGLGYLLVVITAMASIFMRGQLSLAFASCISLFVIAESIYIGNQTDDLQKQLFSAGLLGILVFLTAVAFNYLTERIRSSDFTAWEKARYARHLEHLAQHIVTRMQTGIIVIDPDNTIELINDSALKLLDCPAKKKYVGKALSSISELHKLVEEWKKQPILGISVQHHLRSGEELRINFAKLDTEFAERVILYLEDYRAIAQQAQQLKLASLGTLTASIAHEVRNPLGAIAHAAQLLRESEHLHRSDERLVEIMLNHSARVNQIIDNTLSLSRKKEPQPEPLDLTKWIPKFINEYKSTHQCRINFLPHPISTKVKMDPAHLHQVLTNLVENGLRYSQQKEGRSSVAIRIGIHENDQTSYLEVLDDGAGVPEDKVDEIFDPFFTSDEKGSGLGLYISKELCEINQATLNYHRTDDNFSSFKIHFPHHQRMI